MQVTDDAKVLLKWICGVQEREIIVDAVHLRCRHTPEDRTNHTLRVGVLLSWYKLGSDVISREVNTEERRIVSP